MTQLQGRQPRLTTALIVVVALVAIVATGVSGADYDGTVRIFMSERLSRWTDGLGVPYNNGFLDFSLTQSVQVKEFDFWDTTLVWNSVGAGFGGMSTDELVIQAVMFADTAVVTDAFPPYGHLFDAYYADAAAQVMGQGVGFSHCLGFSHQVWVELAGSSG